MRALIFNGSTRPMGNSSNLTGDIIEKLEREGIETLRVDLYSYKFTPCNACLTCEMRGDGMCADQSDGTNEILGAMREADLILFISPSYAGSIPGPVRTFMEKASLILEKGDKGLRGKYGAAITVSEHDGAETAYWQYVYWMLRAQMLVVGSCPMPIIRALVSPEYTQDKLAMRGVDNLISNIVRIAEDM